ncbi:MAG: hypothetical protein AB7Q17_08775 [Phycisphaerae bacterium]
MTAEPSRRAVSIAARVARVTRPCREHVAIELALDSFPPSHPGQFLQLRCADDDHLGAGARVVEWAPGRTPEISDPDLCERRPYLRRPFSIADRWDTGRAAHLIVISRAIGAGTRWLDALTAQDALNITGPLGHGFDLPPAGQPVVLVGGGVGIPPLLYLARRLRERGHVDATLILGAMSRDLFPVELYAEPAAAGTPRRCAALPGDADYPTMVTTDDGTLGLRGYTTGALQVWAEHRRRDAVPPLVFACGPEGMLRAVARLTRTLGYSCQLCIERTMGCGVGTCLSCVARMRDASAPTGWRWALSCSVGPVFDRDALPDYDDDAPPRRH